MTEGLRTTKTDPWTGTHDYTRVAEEVVHDSNNNTVITPDLSQRSISQDWYLHEDRTGSTRYITDSTGNNCPSALRYDAFGQRTATVGPAHPTEALYAGEHGYQTEYRDATEPGTGLQYLEERYYEPETGRFLSPDPTGFAGGDNLFTYADGDPTNMVDPSGESPGDIIGAAGVAVSWAEAAAAPSAKTVGLAVLDTVTELVPGVPGTSVRHGTKLLQYLPGAARTVRYYRRADSAVRAVKTAVSIKAVKMALGRVGVPTRDYLIRMATNKDYINRPQNAKGFMTVSGTGALERDAKGRPVIVLFPEALVSMDEAILTVAEEIRHIKDALAGVQTLDDDIARQYARQVLGKVRRCRKR